MLAAQDVCGDTGAMKGFGDRLRARAKDLGLSDSEVARRLGLSQARYSHYVNGVHEPDLDTLVRIVRALGMSADQALGMEAHQVHDEVGVLRGRIAVAAGRMNAFTLRAVAAMVEAVADSVPLVDEGEAAADASPSKPPRKRSSTT